MNKQFNFDNNFQYDISSHLSNPFCLSRWRQYLLILDGNAWNRTVETVKFYLALVRNNIPVYLNDAELLADRLTEKEKIGIVPQGVIPKYCDSYFPNENIIDFINLPYDKDDTEKMLPYCSWYPIEKIELINSADELM